MKPTTYPVDGGCRYKSPAYRDEICIMLPDAHLVGLDSALPRGGHGLCEDPPSTPRGFGHEMETVEQTTPGTRMIT